MVEAEIIIDKRERKSLVAHELISLGTKIKFEMLPVADYLIGKTAVERKTASDFVSSIVNKRLLRQLEEIKQFKKALLIIEGDLYETDFNENAIRGMLLSIMLDHRIPIVFTSGCDETAKFLSSLVKREGKNRPEIGLKAKKKAYSLAEQQQIIIEGLPSIGPNLARALLKKFKTIRAIANADEEDLQEVEKIGKKKAKIIKNIVEVVYRPG